MVLNIRMPCLDLSHCTDPQIIPRKISVIQLRRPSKYMEPKMLLYTKRWREWNVKWAECITYKTSSMQILGQMKNYEFQCFVDCYVLDGEVVHLPQPCNRFHSINSTPPWHGSIRNMNRKETKRHETKDSQMGACFAEA